jgi:D-alanine-D-alanine ligase-like ATP-grasp enzyme
VIEFDKRYRRIAVLHPSFSGSTAPYKDHDVERDFARHLDGIEVTNIYVRKPTAVRQVQEACRSGFDVIVNMCDGSWGEDTPGIEVVQALEKEGVPFTGASSGFYEPSRLAMKMAAHSAGVLFPAFFIARSAADARKCATALSFPMIVKHPESYSSVGLTRNSRVESVSDLGSEIERMCDLFHGALVEEYIEGREFTVLVSEGRNDCGEPWVLPPAEFVFPPGEHFKHFDLKWKEYERMTSVPVTDARLSERLCRAAGEVFQALSGDGYARCDFRMNSAGEVFFLEINPNCSIFYPEGSYGSADLILANERSGHRRFLSHLLDCAIRRACKRRTPYQILFRKDSGFGLFATQCIGAGSVVDAQEGRAHNLVSRSHVEQTWTNPMQLLFRKYAWAIGNEIYGIWSDNPGNWRPINHSCDPNVEMKGLDVVARRDIHPGEQLTIDYAAFCGPDMEIFQCRCGSPMCRGTIVGH